jgi:hypothetical protein
MQRLGRWMDAIESRIGGLLGRKSHQEAPAGRREPVEIRIQALREIAGRVQPTGRGGYYFPAAGVKLTLRSAVVASAFSNPQFEQDLQAELEERGCSAGRVPVTVEIVEGSGQPVEIEYVQALQSSSEKDRPVAYLTVIRGKASVPKIRISGDRIYIGRMIEVRHKDGSVIRRNDVPFEESETTVARKHAWVQYEPETERYRVFNDPTNTGRGTQVVRNGSTLQSDTVRGVELRHSDEIHLGNCVVRFEAPGRDCQPPGGPPTVLS